MELDSIFFHDICKMIKRAAEKKVRDLAKKLKAVAVTGPRQSGKTTLVRTIFQEKPYLSLENPDVRNFALEDPRGFLEGYKDGAILDEVQRAPELLSYLQEKLDNSRTKGQFILTGSNNFLLHESVTQSLAGRVGILNLLPFSLSELNSAGISPRSDDQQMIMGFYPPVHDQGIPPEDWCPNYVRTYIERDVRQIRNITDLIVFERFMKLLAGRSGQELNNSALAVETGVDVKTIISWIGILEASFIIHLLKPHHRNFKKVIVKRPKVYFCDTAIACHLLGIREPGQLAVHPLRGALFEGMVVTELLKNRLHAGLPSNLFFWRDKTGHEIDLILDDGQHLLPVEIKSGQTISSAFFSNLDYWKNLSGIAESVLLYAGTEGQTRSSGMRILNWREFVTIGQ